MVAPFLAVWGTLLGPGYPAALNRCPNHQKQALSNKSTPNKIISRSGAGHLWENTFTDELPAQYQKQTYTCVLESSVDRLWENTLKRTNCVFDGEGLCPKVGGSGDSLFRSTQYVLQEKEPLRVACGHASASGLFFCT